MIAKPVGYRPPMDPALAACPASVGCRIAVATWAGASVVELAEFIGDLRDELTKAIATASPEGLRFELGTVELEVSVAVAKEATPGAKVKFWVVEVGGEASFSHSASQKITLTLTPTAPDGSPPFVSGAAVDGED
jgi:hypothetical protein